MSTLNNTYLFVDDERQPSDVTWIVMPSNVIWKVVRSFDEFVNFISEKGLPAFISFDHDLADDHYKDFFVCSKHKLPLRYDKYKEKTGYHCAKWLVDYCLEKGVDFPEYVVHSMNNIGADNIKGLISSYRKYKNNESD